MTIGLMWLILFVIECFAFEGLTILLAFDEFSILVELRGLMLAIFL